MKFVIVMITLMLVSSCTVYSKDMKQAEVLCVKNGGVYSISSNWVGMKTVKCQNGAEFENPGTSFKNMTNKDGTTP